MKRYEPTIWTTPLPLTTGDMQRLARSIAEEMRYYNGLIAGLNGPQRTMPDTFKNLVGKMENLFGAIAASGHQISTLTPSSVPVELNAFRDVLFDSDGKSKLDVKTRMILDVAAAPGVLPPETRREIAMEMLRTFRNQSEALSGTLLREDQVYRRSVETLVPIDMKVKRHLQIPRSALTVIEHADDIVLHIPGVQSPAKLPVPPLAWNIAVIRPDSEQWSLELRKESVPYMLRLFDPIPSRRKSKPVREAKSARQ